jgi:hypothetical protein
MMMKKKMKKKKKEEQEVPQIPVNLIVIILAECVK